MPSSDGMVQVPKEEMDLLCEKLDEMRSVAMWYHLSKSKMRSVVLTFVWAQSLSFTVALAVKAMIAGWLFPGIICIGTSVAILLAPFVLDD